MTPIMIPKNKGYQMPAEWERHECCWMQWPHDNSKFNSYAEVPTWSHFDIEKGSNIFVLSSLIICLLLSHLIAIFIENKIEDIRNKVRPPRITP